MGIKPKSVEKEDQGQEDTKNYLKFVAMRISERMSFLQIENIEKFLKIWL